MSKQHHNAIFGANYPPSVSQAILTGLIALFSFSICFAQTVAPHTTNSVCPSDEWHRHEMSQNPQFRQQQARFEEAYQRALSQPQALSLRSGVYTFPVVIHIFHSGEAVGTPQNPSDAALKTWLEASNSKLRHTSGMTFTNNPFSGVDCELELCLARQDPSNNPISGIKRYNMPAAANASSWDTYHSLIRPKLWDRTKYCNVVIISKPPANSGFTGAFFPNSADDFIAFQEAVFTNNQGNANIMVHEFGHYLSLFHPWENGCTNNNCQTDGDKVCDTPPRAGNIFASGSSCSNPGNSCTTDENDASSNNPFRATTLGGLGEKPDSYENYMDYTGCNLAFTQGQKARMRAYVETVRASFTTASSVCTPVSNACLVPTDLSVATTNTNATVAWAENASATNWEIKYGPVGFDPTTNGVSIVTTSNPYTISGLTAGATYEWYVRSLCTNLSLGISTFSAVSSFTVPTTLTYCAPLYISTCYTFNASSCTYRSYLTSFTLTKTTDNTTLIDQTGETCLGKLSDYSSTISGNIINGQNYTFNVRNGSFTGFCYTNMYVGIWIDYNSDGDFEDADEQISISPNAVRTYSGNFTVPNTVASGAKRLRVRLYSANSTAPLSCSQTIEGEAEDYTVVVSATPLPVTLRDFLGKNTEGGNFLTWATAEEKNTTHFDIERSTNGRDFEKIGTVKAKGSNSNYAFTDNITSVRPTLENLYYRLKINDLDGKTAFSKTILIEKTGKSTVKIYPSVTSSVLTIENAKAFEIINSVGQVVMQETRSSGNFQSFPNLTHLPSGFYIVKGVDTEGGVFSQKIIKE